MTALPVQNDDRPALRLAGAPEGDVWVPIGAAAQAMGMHEGVLRRQCAGRLLKRGLARKIKPPGARNAAWHVHRSHDRRLLLLNLAAPGPAPGTQPVAGMPAIERCTQSQRDDAMRRAAMLRDFRRWRVRPGVRVRRDYPAFRAELARDHGEPTPSLSQIYAWHQAAPACREGDAGAFADVVAALIDTRGRPSGQRGATRVDADAWTMFEGLYLRSPAWSTAKCWRVVAAEAQRRGWAWPSQRHARRLVAERIPAQAAVLAREGEDAWREKCAAPMMQAPDAWAPGERWDADHARFDFFIRVQRGGVWVADRPWLSAWIDWRTRTLVGWWISTAPNAHTVQRSLLHALRHGYADAGPPRIAWLDNGKDYDSAAITGATKQERRAWRTANARGDTPARLGGAHGWGENGATRAVGLLGLLGVEAHFAQPYNHNGKARVERMFATLHADFDTDFATYCGSERIGVDTDTLARRVKDVMSLPTIEEIEERFAAWADAYNRRDAHSIDDLFCPESGERLAPMEYLRRHAPVRRVLADPAALDLLAHRWERPLAVGKRGVGVTIAGRRVYYGDLEPALEPYKGGARRVFVTRDPADTTEIRVYDERMRFVCVARENGAYGQGVSEEARKAAHAARRDQRRRARERVDLAALTATDAQLAAREQRRMDVERTRADLAAAGADPGPGANLRIVRTPVDGESPRVERERLRKAAGAERFSAEDREIERSIDLANLVADAPAAPDHDFDFDDLDEDDFLDEDDDIGDEPLADDPLPDNPDDDDDPLGALA